MTERVPRSTQALATGVEGSRRFPGAAAHLNVTPEVVDIAVEEVLRDAQISPEAGRVMRQLMSGDSGSAVAQAYFHGAVAGPQWNSVARVARRRMEVPYALTDSQVALLSQYAEGYDLRFAAREAHDHPMAAACRMVDRDLVASRLPPGPRVSHIGGAVIPLVLTGLLGHGHHACLPVLDRKDPGRQVLDRLRMRKVASDKRRSAEVVDSAKGFLARDLAYVCGLRVQDCNYASKILTSVHVYDIAMSEWPAIMSRKRAELVEGCMLFPRDIFSRNSGEMVTAGARYEVDTGENTFRMGFMGSPSWWYEHRLSDYLKYGVDQILSDGKATYSYKVVERRGDTLFFRILRVHDDTLPNYVQHYRVPGVKMVRVNGFPLTGKIVPWSSVRRVYMFPQPLWEDMLGHAKEMVERDVFSHERLFNYYRTVAPRQSINAVTVAGGASVEDLNQLVPLVVHVALFAFSEVLKLRQETTALVDAAMQDRVREEEWTVYKMMAALSGAVSGLFKLSCAPLLWMAKVVGDGVDGYALARTYDWEVEPSVQEVSAKLILPHCFVDESEVVAGFEEDYTHLAPATVATAARADESTAAFMLDVFGDVLPEEMREPLQAVLPEVVAPEYGGQSEGLVSVPADLTIPSVTGLADVLPCDAVEVERRRASIEEAILECEAEASKAEAACSAQFRELLVGGSPNRKKIEARKEMFCNPEFWRVVGGVIESSFSGAPVEGFQHAAVYCPTPMDGARVTPVLEEEFKGMSRGEYVENVYYKVADLTYSGWVYTNDSLLIHNGPAIADAMREAMALPLDFEVALNQGPPGCGKTTAILGRARPEDVVLVPVRKAARETASRMLEMHPKGYEEMAEKQIRTLDSYLVNKNRMRYLRKLTASRLLADEAFMAREGRWLAAAALLGVSQVEAFGDRFQIPHVPRAECPKAHVALQYQTMDETYLTYRCPPQLVACWGGVFDWRVRSASKVDGVVVQVRSAKSRTVPSGCVMMGMYQADKKLLREMYAGCGVPVHIMTVHESQGNTYKDVWLHRFDLRRRTDNFSLYDKSSYALVAMSRSTHSFVYVSPPLGDMVSKWIELGRDVRRVNAARDVASAGHSIEKI